MNAHPLVSGRIGGIMNILALCWCPGVVVFVRRSPHLLQTISLYTPGLERLEV